MYRQVATQYLRYCMRVTANVASVYETWKTVEQPGDVYVNSPKEKSKEAVAFLTKEVFTTPEWLLDNEILNKISNPVRIGSVANTQTRILDLLLSDRVFNTLLMEENRYGKGNTYSIVELMDDVKAGVWTELKNKKPIDIFRRGLQKNYVSNVLASIKEAEAGEHYMALLFGGPAASEALPVTISTDIGSFLALHLEKLRGEILAVIPTVTDKDSKDHLNYIAEQIKNSLNNRLNK